MKMWYIVDMILTMIAACVERASCVSALFRQALDVLEVDALRVWSSRKVPRPHFSLPCEAITFLLSIYQHHAVFAVLPNTFTQSALLLPPREVHIGAMLGLTVMSQAITLSGF